MADAVVPFRNGLTPAQAELLELLTEECAEVIQAAMKIKRHGWESCDPTVDGGPTNRQWLEHEIGHVLHAVNRLTTTGDLAGFAIGQAEREKSRTVRRWLHHQSDAAPLSVGRQLLLQAIKHGAPPVEQWTNIDTELTDDDACPVHGPDDGEGHCWACHRAAVAADSGSCEPW